MEIVNDLIHLDCPVCDSRNISPIGKLELRSAVRFSSATISLRYPSELWRCKACKSKFIQHSIKEEDARQLYISGEAGQRWSTKKFEENKTKQVVRCLSGLFFDHARLLDVGANTGELLNFARKFNCITAGLEYSAKSRQELLISGHLAYESFDQIDQQFDVITAFDLIEHIYNFAEFIESCRQKITPGGHLVLLTGDIESLSARLAGSSWWYVQYPEHIIFLSHASLLSLPGFILKSVDHTYASVAYKRSILLGAVQYLRYLFKSRNYNGLPSLGPDHMLVVLQKIRD